MITGDKSIRGPITKKIAVSCISTLCIDMKQNKHLTLQNGQGTATNVLKSFVAVLKSYNQRDMKD